MKFKLYQSEWYHNKKNLLFQKEIIIQSINDLIEVNQFDFCLSKMEGSRSQDNWRESSVLFLDYDSGKKISDFMLEFKNYEFYVSTSRNHQKVKDGKPACDRFHVYFPIEPIADPIEYDELLKELSRRTDADKSVMEISRFYFGNKETQCFYNAGEPITNWLNVEIEKEQKINDDGRNSYLFDIARKFRQLNTDCTAESLRSFIISEMQIAIGNPYHKANVIFQTGELPEKEIKNIIKSVMKSEVKDLSPAGDADYFCERVKGKIIYCLEEKKFYEFKGGVWSPDVKIHSLIIKIFKERMTLEKELKVKKYINRILKSKSIPQLTMAIIQETLRFNYDDFNKNTHLLNFKNGTFDLESNSFVDHNPEDYITIQLKYDYNPKITDHSEFEKFLKDISLDNEEWIDYIQKLLGTGLYASPEKRNFTIFQGQGLNGKGVLTRVLEAVLQEYCLSVGSNKILFSNKFGNNNDTVLSGLQYKRIVFFNEGTSAGGTKLDIELIKQLTGGDTITINKKYMADPVSFKPLFTSIMCSNSEPEIEHVDKAIRDRIRIVPFRLEKKQDERDEHLVSKLIKNKQAIMNWLIEGYQKYREIGLKMPEVIQTETEDYFEGQDIIDQFLLENTTKDIFASILFSEFYVMFCRKMSVPISKKRLASKLRSKGVHVKPGSDNQKFVFGYQKKWDEKDTKEDY